MNDAGADVIRLGAEQLFGDARPQLDRARQLLRSMIFFTASAAAMFSGMPELWPSPWPGRAFDHRLVPGDAGLLRRLRNVVDVGAERDHRLARSPVATHAVGMPATPRSIVKPFFFEDCR